MIEKFKLLNIINSFEEIKAVKMNYFTKILRNITNYLTFKYLIRKVKSKGKDIDHG